jgi:septal ring factor EnvC (AmiA/AmiB activator)
MAEKHIRRSLTAWQRDYERLEGQYSRQQKLLKELQDEKRATKKDKSSAVKDSIRRERERKKLEDERIKKAGALTAKATTAASTAVVGYYLVAEELGTLWVVSEAFTKSEWFQAILTSLVAWFLAQAYSMVARR